MNKFFKLLSIFFLSASVVLVSCKGDQGEQGPIGPQGTPGTNGTNGTNGSDGADGADGADGIDGIDGNANIKSFDATIAVTDWSNVEVPGIGSGSTSTWGGAAYMNAEITSDKALLVFVKSGDEKFALPLTLIKDVDESVESLNFSYANGQANVYYKRRTALFGGTPTYVPDGALNMEFLVMEKSFVAAMKAAGINTENRDEVVNYMNGRGTAPSQL